MQQKKNLKFLVVIGVFLINKKKLFTVFYCVQSLVCFWVFFVEGFLFYIYFFQFFFRFFFCFFFNFLYLNQLFLSFCLFFGFQYYIILYILFYVYLIFISFLFYVFCFIIIYRCMYKNYIIIKLLNDDGTKVQIFCIFSPTTTGLLRLISWAPCSR